jgi:hypothetical protein
MTGIESGERRWGWLDWKRRVIDSFRDGEETHQLLIYLSGL